MIHLQMVGELIVVISIFLMLSMYALISRFIASPPQYNATKNKLVATEKRKGIVVIFGASGKIGINVIRQFLEHDYNVVGMGRQYARWVEAIDNAHLDSYIRSGQLQWHKVDVRLHREIQDSLESVQKILGKIDICVNLSVIEPNFDPLVDSISSALDGSDITIRLPGAYSQSYGGRYDLFREGTPGNENSFFTNLVGLLNLNRIEQEMGIDRIVNPANIDDISDALTKLLSKLDPQRTITISFKPNQNIDLIL